MKIVAGCTLIIIATLFTGAARAEDSYIGLSRTTPGEAYGDFAGARHVENYNNPLALKLYGGVNFTENYGVELGYGFFGTWKVADPAAGSRKELRFSSRMMYVAGRAVMPVGDSLSLFGKAGLAVNRVRTQSNTDLPSSRTSAVRPMLGFGADYKLIKNLSAVLEFDYYNKVKDFKQQKVELGLKYAF